MKTLLVALAIALTTGSAAQAFDAQTQAIIDRHKSGKLVAITDVAHLMEASAQWCYAHQDHSCSWTDIYLEVRDDGATFEIGNAWDEDTHIAFTDEGVFKDGRYICESGLDWVPSVRATRRNDGSVIGGRQLWEIKAAVALNRDAETQQCFDYLYLSSNPDQEVVTLLQREYIDDEYQSGGDVEVSVHFNAEDAAGLLLRW